MHTTTAGTVPPRNHHRIPPSWTAVHADIRTLRQAIPPIMKATRPDSKQRGEILSRSEGVMTRVRMVNAMLRHHGIDCSELDALTGSGSAQLAAALAMNQSGNSAVSGPAIQQFRSTAQRLRDTYHEILTREDLPGDAAQGVLSVARSLAVTAVDGKTS